MEKLFIAIFLLVSILMVVALGLGIAALWRRLARPEGGRAGGPPPEYAPEPWRDSRPDAGAAAPDPSVAAAGTAPWEAGVAAAAPQWPSDGTPMGAPMGAPEGASEGTPDGSSETASGVPSDAASGAFQAAAPAAGGAAAGHYAGSPPPAARADAPAAGPWPAVPRSPARPRRDRTDGSARRRGPASWPIWSSTGGRFAALAALAALTLIPLSLIGSLITERSARQSSVVWNLSQEWGPSQSLVGPLLAFPFTVAVTEVKKVAVATDDPDDPPSWREVRSERRETRWAVLTPSRLGADVRVSPETRRRGIYGALVWTAGVVLEGSFSVPDGLAGKLDLAGGPLGERLEAVHWDQARVVVGLSGPQALRGVGRLSLAGAERDFQPGLGLPAGVPAGFSAPVDLSGAMGGRGGRTGRAGPDGQAGQAGPGGQGGRPALPFRIELTMAGSGLLSLAPVGDQNEIALASAWPHPRFTGSSLPGERSVSESGFEAKWSVPAMARGYQSLRAIGAAEAGAAGQEARQGCRGPSCGPDGGTVYEGFVVGVELLNPVDSYRMTDRAVKYSLLFIALNFLIFALWERNLGRAAFHPVQYAVIGLALAMFYLVLLALSEHLGFGRAYLAASVLDVILVGGYALMITASKRGSLAVGALLGVLHLVLYVFLGMEDYALLAGTALLVAGLAALMVSTRRISGPGAEAAPAGPGGPGASGPAGNAAGGAGRSGTNVAGFGGTGANSAGPGGAGVDRTGADGAGFDGAGFGGSGANSAGPGGAGVGRTGADEAGPGAAGRDEAGGDVAGPGGTGLAA